MMQRPLDAAFFLCCNACVGCSTCNGVIVMNLDNVKEIVKLNRQIRNYAALMRSGELTEAEATLAMGDCALRIEELRKQRELPLESPLKGKKGSDQ